MKTKILFVLVTIISILLFANCSKEIDRVFDAYIFSTDSLSSTNNYTLFLNNNNKGTLSFIHDSIAIKEDPGLMYKSYRTQMRNGKYELRVQDPDNKVISSFVFEIKITEKKSMFHTISKPDDPDPNQERFRISQTSGNLLVNYTNLK